MTPLEIIDLVIGLLCLVDALMYLLIPLGVFDKWFGFLSKTLKSKSRWMITLLLLVVILAFGYFVMQQVTVLQIVPGIFIGVGLMKMLLTNYYHDELVPMIKRMSKSIDWLSLAMDLLIAIAVFWILFFK
jgi:cation transport ATPase